MSVESATWASQLNTETPRGTDSRSEGDDQLRLVKAVTQTEFDYANKEWIYTGSTVTRQSTISFSTSANETATYSVGRRVKITGTATGTVYGTVASATYSSATNVNLRLDSGTLANERLYPYVSFITDTGFPRASFVTSSGTTGGSGSAGSGNEYILMTINGVTYKVLYDGVSLGTVDYGLIFLEGIAGTVERVAPNNGQAFLENHTLTAYAINSAISAGIRLTSAGVLQTLEMNFGFGDYTDDNNEWAINRSTGVGSGFEAKLTRATGSNATSGTMDSWLALSSNRTWQWDAGIGSTVSFTGALRVRPASANSATASSNISVTVSSEFLLP